MMNGDFEKLEEQLKQYEKELEELCGKYNPSDSGLKLELLVMNMLIVFYQFLIACIKAVNDSYKEKYYEIARKILTTASYLLTGIAVGKAPMMVIPGILGSLGLSIRNLRYDMDDDSRLSVEQTDKLLQLIDEFENKYLNKIDSIMEIIDVYEDDQVINNLSEPEKSKRIACKKLMQFLREDNSDLFFEDESFSKNLIDIINESLNTDSNNIYELIQILNEKYQQLNEKICTLCRKNNRISRINKLLI